MISAITAATIGVHDIEPALRLFQNFMGLRIESDGRMTPAQRRHLDVPLDVEGRLVELSCEGHPFGRLRLATLGVPGDAAAPKPRPPDMPGPRALDFYTKCPLPQAAATLNGMGYAPDGPPIRYRIGALETEELIVAGPAGVPIMLMRGFGHPVALERPTGAAFSEIATVSIVTCDLDAGRRFYGGILGLTVLNDAATSDEHVDLVAALTGMPRGTPSHLLLFGRPDESSGKVLLVRFGHQDRRIPPRPISPPRYGISLIGFHSPELIGLRERLHAGGFQPSLPFPLAAAPNGLAAFLVAGPSGELLEIRGPA